MNESEIIDSRSPSERAVAFLLAWRDLRKGGEVEFRAASTADGRPGIVITLGNLDHVFTLNEAGVVADIIDDACKIYPVESVEEGLPQMRKAILDTIEIVKAQP
jgi:hypothetical protein